MGKVRLSANERSRVEVLLKVQAGQLSQRAAAEAVGVSYRQLKRVYARFLEEGVEGLAHRLRTQTSNHRVEVSKRARIVELYQSKYSDFGPTLASEYLLREDQERVSEETLRQWLITAGLWQAKQRGARHRQWRERRAHWGELLQMDGSNHDWFEGRRGKASLMVMIDDATNWTHAKFFESESTESAMKIFWEYVDLYGLPRALYVDRAAIYITTRDATTDETLRNTEPLTQFGRSMQALGVALICAHSPQAKGRVERRHRVFQDRLVKELRLKTLSDLAAANRFLDEEFLDLMNAKFSVTAREPTDLHRSLPRGVKLAHVLCYQEERVVNPDWTVSWCNRILQVAERHQKLTLVKKKILVSELLDGRLRLTFKNQELTWQELPARPTPPSQKKPPQPTSTPPHKPAANHPWRSS